MWCARTSNGLILVVQSEDFRLCASLAPLLERSASLLSRPIIHCSHLRRNCSGVTPSSANKELKEHDKVGEKHSKSRSTSLENDVTKTKEQISLVNGYLDGDITLSKSNFHNDANGKTDTGVVINGETEAAVNSILETTDPEIDELIKMDVEQAKNMQSQIVAERKSISKPELDILKGDSNHNSYEHSNSKSLEQEHSEKEDVAETTKDIAVKNCDGDGVSVKISETDGVAVEMPPDSKTTSTSDSKPVTNNVESPTTPVKPASQPIDNSITTTPTNPIPHSALNQRLKETITRRRSANATATSSPTNNLPPSVLQQYSYKQVSFSICALRGVWLWDFVCSKAFVGLI